MLLESGLEVIFGSNWITKTVLKSKCEVADDPKKAWEVSTEIVRILLLIVATFYLDLVRQVGDQRKVLKRVFINCADGIVNEK